MQPYMNRVPRKRVLLLGTFAIFWSSANDFFFQIIFLEKIF